jgi:hypothetical protein
MARQGQFRFPAQPDLHAFLRSLGFDAIGAGVSKTVGKFFHREDRRLSVALFGGGDAPDFILIAHHGGSHFEALVQTPEREKLRYHVNQWRRRSAA